MINVMHKSKFIRGCNIQTSKAWYGYNWILHFPRCNPIACFVRTIENLCQAPPKTLYGSEWRESFVKTIIHNKIL